MSVSVSVSVRVSAIVSVRVRVSVSEGECKRAGPVTKDILRLCVCGTPVDAVETIWLCVCVCVCMRVVVCVRMRVVVCVRGGHVTCAGVLCRLMRLRLVPTTQQMKATGMDGVKTIDLSAVHPSKARLPISWKRHGSLREMSAGQLLNAKSPMLVKKGVCVKDERFLQPQNARVAICINL